MVKVREDLTGQTFGTLTVLKQAEDYVDRKGQHYAQWLCECSCKKRTQLITRGSHLKNGHTTSCGCSHIKEDGYKKKGNKKDLSGDFGIIWSTNTNEEIYFDLEDADKILKYTWSVGWYGYPTAYINNKVVRMHVLIGCKWHDHHNHNKLDNRKENLIPCTHQENTRNCSPPKNNTSGFIGVSWNKNRGEWASYITVDYKDIHLGSFVDKVDAIRARLQAELKFFGEFAPQRHLFEEYNII